ncbi:c-type cytochrome [Magnetospira thiophila]
MTRTFAISLAISSAMALTAPAMAQGPSGAMLANTCAGCHGTNGSSVGPASPNIAGFTKTYFIQSMMDYKSGARSATIMDRIAKGYSDADIAAMADFFSQQTLAPGMQATDDSKSREGLQLHELFCESCHKDKGRANGQGPLLAGQMIPYVKYSLEDFLGDERPGPTKMKLAIRHMHSLFGEAGGDALAQYYGSLK